MAFNDQLFLCGYVQRLFQCVALDALARVQPFNYNEIRQQSVQRNPQATYFSVVDSGNLSGIFSKTGGLNCNGCSVAQQRLSVVLWLLSGKGSGCEIKHYSGGRKRTGTKVKRTFWQTPRQNYCRVLEHFAIFKERISERDCKRDVDICL